MTRCPRCDTRLLPGALACINCDLPVTSEPDPATSTSVNDPSLTSSDPRPGEPPASYSGYEPGPLPWTPYGEPPPDLRHHNAPAPWTTNGLAIASLILAVLWLGGVGSLLGVVFGHVSRGQMKRHPQRGGGVAIAGLIIGYVGLVGSVVFWASIPKIVNSDLVQNPIAQQDIRDAASAEVDYFHTTGSFTADPAALRAHGFDPIGDNLIEATYDGGDGFCLVGAHTGSGTWYLYDSTNGDLQDEVYSTREAAEGACTVPHSGVFTPITF